MLYVSWKDLMSIKTSGRWWIIGNAWKPISKNEEPKEASEQSIRLLKLAIKFKMNSKLRRRIFISIMGAKNPTNAVKRLEKINLESKQEREIVRILFKMLMKSKCYNPFFSYLLQKLCNYRYYRFTIQVAIWNQIKGLSNISMNEIGSFGNTIGHLIATLSIPLTCLRVYFILIDFIF
jgi:nucleolar MIF4G domain-containing protein 1